MSTPPAESVRVTVPRPPTRTVWHCLPSGHANDLLRAACRECGAHRPCEHFDGSRHCGAVPVHMYICGPRCDPHKP